MTLFCAQGRGVTTSQTMVQKLQVLHKYIINGLTNQKLCTWTFLCEATHSFWKDLVLDGMLIRNPWCEHTWLCVLRRDYHGTSTFTHYSLTSETSILDLYPTLRSYTEVQQTSSPCSACDVDWGVSYRWEKMPSSSQLLVHDKVFCLPAISQITSW